MTGPPTCGSAGPTRDVVDVLDHLASLVSLPAPGDAMVRLADTAVGPDDHDAADRLADAVYQRWYLTPPRRSGSTPKTQAGLPALGRTDLAALLRAAHADAERFEEGWLVASAAPDGHCHVTRSDVGRVVQPGEYISATRQGVPAAPGETVKVVARRDWTDHDTGFWCAQATIGPPEAPLSRAYLNVPASAIPYVLHTVTALLDAERVRYSLKCPLTAAGYDRVDSLVIYHGRRRESQLERRLIAAHATTIGKLLEEPVPPLTRRVAPGLAFAHEPTDGGSFGESRCRALARGLLAVARDGVPRGQLRERLIKELSSSGIDPLRPWSVT